MTLEQVQELHDELIRTKLHHLDLWEPTPGSLNLDIRNLGNTASMLNEAMAQQLDHPDVHRVTYALRQAEAALSFEDFSIWNASESERLVNAGKRITETTKTKLMTIIGF